MDSNAEIKNINVDSNTVTIDGKSLQQFIIDTIVNSLKKYTNNNSKRHINYEQQQRIIDEKESAKQCIQTQKAQIEEMQRRIAKLNVNAWVNKSIADLINGE